MKSSRSVFLREWEGKKIHLKIGIDTGRTIVRLARQFPNELFVGIEKNSDRARVAKERSLKAGLSNVLIRAVEAHTFLKKIKFGDIFSEAHIYFPTPKDEIRGGIKIEIQEPLITRNFLDELSRKITLGGVVRILTDREDYFQDIQKAVRLDVWWPQGWSHYSCGQKNGEFIGTPCERRFRAEDREIFAIQLKKVGKL